MLAADTPFQLFEPREKQLLCLWIEIHQKRVFRRKGREFAEDFFRHAPNSKEFSRGQEKPDPNSFFEPVARALRDTGAILIFGTGTGMSSEMDQFNEWLKLHHPEVAGRVIGSLVVDEHHMTEGQLLAKAREFYAHHRMVHP